MRARAWLLILLVQSILTLISCRERPTAAKADPLLKTYDVEKDWDDPQHLIPLNYQQAQGKRVFYHNCVWCHADTTPAGPSNRYTVTPTPPLANDGETCNALSDQFMQNIITLGGSALGKSAMMPPWGQTLTQEEIKGVITFMRAIAQPTYHPPARPGPEYSVK